LSLGRSPDGPKAEDTILDIANDFFFASEAGTALLWGNIPDSIARVPRTLDVICTTIGAVSRAELAVLMARVYPAARGFAARYGVTLAISLPWASESLVDLPEVDREARVLVIKARATASKNDAPWMHVVLSGDGYEMPLLAPTLSPEQLDELVEQFTPAKAGSCCVIS